MGPVGGAAWLECTAQQEFALISGAARGVVMSYMPVGLVHMLESTLKSGLAALI